MTTRPVEWPVVFLEAYCAVAEAAIEHGMIAPLAVLAIAAESAIPCSKVPFHGWGDANVASLTRAAAWEDMADEFELKPSCSFGHGGGPERPSGRKSSVVYRKSSLGKSAAPGPAAAAPAGGAE